MEMISIMIFTIFAIGSLLLLLFLIEISIRNIWFVLKYYAPKKEITIGDLLSEIIGLLFVSLPILNIYFWNEEVKKENPEEILYMNIPLEWLFNGIIRILNIKIKKNKKLE